MTRAVAVIGDIVGSRTYPDRARAQAAVQAAMTRVNAAIDHLEPLAPTVGDEFQALYADVESALCATLLLRLELATPFDCRFGIGAGDVTRIDSSLQDGSAWWSARDAIVEAKRRESGSTRSLRTWFVSAEGAAAASVTNAYLLCRDELVARLDDRGRRLLLGTMWGATQSELAEREGITQSAVSQKLARSGVHAILASTDQLTKG